MTISETADTFSTKVEPVDITKISPIYKESILALDKSYQRINFPADYGIRLGCNYRRFLFCHRHDDTLIFSMSQLPEYLNQVAAKGYLYKEHGFAGSTLLDPDEDAIFFLVPEHLSPFEVDEEVHMEFEVGEEDYERRVICRKL